MTERNIRGFGLGLQSGIALVLIFGFFVAVRAVTQGTIQNPAFGPTNNDVKLDFQLSCVDRSPGGRTASCLPGEVLTGGGGDCSSDPDSPTFEPQIGNKYYAACNNGSDNETAHAICCKVIIQ